MRKPEILLQKTGDICSGQTEKGKQTGETESQGSDAYERGICCISCSGGSDCIICMCTIICSCDLNLQDRSQNITLLQRELAEKGSKYNRFNNAVDSVNLEEVRKKAIKEFGMKYAKADQVVTYKSASGNYVKQYKDIPRSGISVESDKVK